MKFKKILMVFVFVLTACSTTKTNGKFDSDAYLNMIGSEPNVLDVVRFQGMVDRKVFYDVLEPLVRISGGKVVEAGAESYEISEDGKTYTFHLRDNYWHDGQKVTSGDYAETIIRSANPESGSVMSSDLYVIEGFEDSINGKEATLGVEIPDDDTLILHLRTPAPALLTTYEFYPERKDYVEQYGDTLGSEAETVASCGPFMVSSWIHNSELVLTKNDQYWDHDNVHLSKVNITINDDTSTAFNSFMSQSIDYLETSTQEEIDKLSKDTRLIKTEIDTAKTYMFIFNQTNQYFKNTKIRQAFSLAIDRDGIVKTLQNGIGETAYGLVPHSSIVGNLNYRDNVSEPLKDLDGEASTLLSEGLKELGLDPQKTITIKLSIANQTAQGKVMGEYYQHMFEKALNVKIKLDFVDSISHFADGKYDLCAMTWGADAEPQFQFSRFYKGGYIQKANADYDKAFETAISSIDEKERLDNYAKAEELLIKDAYIAPVYYTKTIRFQYEYIGGLNELPFDNTAEKTVYTKGR